MGGGDTAVLSVIDTLAWRLPNEAYANSSVRGYLIHASHD